jgi:hydroxypyruvate isomerase
MNRRELLAIGCALASAPLLKACAMPTTDDRRRIGANISMLFLEAPLTERFARAAAAGFGAVEMQFDYADTPAAELARAKSDAGVEVALLNVRMGNPGEPFLSGVPGAQARFKDSVALAQEYCAALACPKVNVLPPTRIEGVSRETQLGVYLENLAYAAEAMAAVGVRVVAEPVNTVDRPQMLVARVEEMVPILDAVGHANLAVQFDIYHVAMMGDPPAETFERWKARVGHIQFADAPGRHEPGTGSIDFAAVLAAIDASGYDGWINGEYVPSGATEAGLGYLAGFARRAA